jgi:hypothetical protein
MPRLSVLNHPVHPILQAIPASLLPASTTFDVLARLGIDEEGLSKAAKGEPKWTLGGIEFWRKKDIDEFAKYLKGVYPERRPDAVERLERTREALQEAQ